PGPLDRAAGRLAECAAGPMARAWGQRPLPNGGDRRITSSVMSDESAATARLLDGRGVSMRPIGADDAAAVLTLHQHLSAHDRYYRFFTLQPVQLDEVVGELTQPAPGRFALGAFDADRLIGVANYTVVYEEPKAAEFAIVVAHEDHSLGVGTAL